MSHYGDFMSEYYNFCSENELKLAGATAMQYAWRIGTNVAEDFKTHLDDVQEQLDEETISGFKKMFTAGGNMSGVKVLSILNGDNANKVYLYKIADKSQSLSRNDIEFIIEDTLGEVKRVKDPLTNLMFNWPYVIKGETVEVTDSYGKYVDSIGGNTGTFNGMPYKNGKLVENISGAIDYVTGDLKIFRTLSDNVTQAENLKDKYNEFLDYTEIPWVPKTSSSGSSSSGGSSSTPTAPKPNKEYYITDNYNIKYTAFVAPAKIIWTYTMEDD